MAYDLRVKWVTSTAETGEADGRETLYVDGIVTGDVGRQRCYVAGKTDGAHAFVFVPTLPPAKMTRYHVNGEEIGNTYLTWAPGSEWGLPAGPSVRQAGVRIPDRAQWLADLRHEVLPPDDAKATGWRHMTKYIDVRRYVRRQR